MQRVPKTSSKHIHLSFSRNYSDNDNCALSQLNDLSPFQQEAKVLSLPKGPRESYVTSLGYCKD